MEPEATIDTTGQRNSSSWPEHEITQARKNTENNPTVKNIALNIAAAENTKAFVHDAGMNPPPHPKTTTRKQKRTA